jgi:hypothetical protein
MICDVCVYVCVCVYMFDHVILTPRLFRHHRSYAGHSDDTHCDIVIPFLRSCVLRPRLPSPHRLVRSLLQAEET